MKIRPFEEQDWPLLLDLANQALPFAPAENVEWLAMRQSLDETKYVRRHFLAFEDGQAVGYGSVEQSAEALPGLRMFVVCSPDRLLGEAGEMLYVRLIEAVCQAGEHLLWAREFQEDAAAEAFFTGHGFKTRQRFTLPGMRPMVIYTCELSAGVDR